MIKRSILTDLEKHLAEPEATVLIGPRQVGKTYLMKLMQDRLLQNGQQTVFLNLDIDADKEFFASQNKLIDYLRLKLGNSRGYVFIDEIQRQENAGLFLKGIYDMQLPYKLIVSGSGSLDLKAKIKESMAGRKQVFVINPISFEEFVNFRTDYQYEDKLQDFFSIEGTRLQGFLEEYLVYGGYPKVILAETIDKKRSVIDEIYKSYIERDIIGLIKVGKPTAFTDLLKILASQIGSLANVSELSRAIGVSSKTILHYLWYLEQTFIVKKVTPFYRNVRSEITKTPTFYFYDTGLRNYLLGLFGLPSIPSAMSGHLFENLILNLMSGHPFFSPVDFHFWRTRDNAEVDFVISRGIENIPVEVKYTKLNSGELARSFKSFLLKYNPPKAYIVHLGLDQQIKFKQTKIIFLPFYKYRRITED